MSDYPRMLYRKGGADSPELHGFHCDTMVADDADAEAAVAGEGWRRTPAEAHGKEPEASTPDTPEARELQDERDGLLQEVEQLRKDLDTVQRERVQLTEQIKTEREAREAAEKERDELNAQIAELTAPEPPKGDKTPKGEKA